MKRTIIEITCETDPEDADRIIIGIENINKEKEFEPATQDLMKLLVTVIYNSQNDDVKMEEVKYRDGNGTERECGFTRDSEGHQE